MGREQQGRQGGSQLSDSEAISSSSSRVAEDADILACCWAGVSSCPSASSSDTTRGVGLTMTNNRTFPNKQKNSESSPAAMNSSLGSNLSELDRLLLELNAVQHNTPCFPTEEDAAPPLPSNSTNHYVQENGVLLHGGNNAPHPPAVMEKPKRGAGARGIEPPWLNDISRRDKDQLVSGPVTHSDPESEGEFEAAIVTLILIRGEGNEGTRYSSDHVKKKNQPACLQSGCLLVSTAQRSSDCERLRKRAVKGNGRALGSVEIQGDNADEIPGANPHPIVGSGRVAAASSRRHIMEARPAGAGGASLYAELEPGAMS
ncbi:hypothetical protein CRUP_002588 [Coryphaenoides rupestris]|nr:hypothetical protein CRUP_002588 [Coryphaenoides rupestris]